MHCSGSAVVGSYLDCDISLEEPTKSILYTSGLWRLPISRAWSAGFFACSWLNEASEASLDLADGKPFGYDRVCEVYDALRVVEAQQHFRMPHRQLALLEKDPCGLRQLKKAQHVRNRRAIFPDRLSNLLLSQSELIR